MTAILSYTDFGLGGGTALFPELNLGNTSYTAGTASLQSAINTVASSFDAFCGDQFVGDTADVSFIMDGPGPDEYRRGRTKLMFPRRVQVDGSNVPLLTSIEERDDAGTWTTRASSAYRVYSSFLLEDGWDGAALLAGTPEVIAASGFLGPYWLPRPLCIRVTGKFGWATTPLRAKRAVALIVYDLLSGHNVAQMRADRWEDANTSYSRSVGVAYGIPEVEDIIGELRFNMSFAVA